MGLRYAQHRADVLHPAPSVPSADEGHVAGRPTVLLLRRLGFDRVIGKNEREPIKSTGDGLSAVSGMYRICEIRFFCGSRRRSHFKHVKNAVTAEIL